jgi:hypothetical protein
MYGSKFQGERANPMSVATAPFAATAAEGRTNHKIYCTNCGTRIVFSENYRTWLHYDYGSLYKSCPVTLGGSDIYGRLTRQEADKLREMLRRSVDNLCRLAVFVSSDRNLYKAVYGVMEDTCDLHRELCAL